MDLFILLNAHLHFTMRRIFVVAIFRDIAVFSGRFVGDAYMRPVRFARYIALPGRLQRAAYMPPLRMTRNIAIATNFPRIFSAEP